MLRIRTKAATILLSNPAYQCPHCQVEQSDEGYKLQDKCHDAQDNWIVITCPACKQQHGFTYDYRGDAVGFKLEL